MRLSATRLTAVASAAQRLFNPRSLFASGEQGAWYDPSDFIPDWRYNLLTYTEQFENAAWTSGPIANGTRTNGAVTVTTSEGYAYVAQSLTLTYAQHVFSVDVVCDQSISNVPVRLSFGVISASTLVSFAAGISQRITIPFTPPAQTTTFNIGIDARDAVVPGGSNATAYVVTFNRAQLEVGSTATTYQRIVTPEITYLADIQPQPVLFQDAAGTTPVTAVEQPVGLMLDKSKGLVLGPELVVNGTFDTSLSGWASIFGSNISWTTPGAVSINNPYGTATQTGVVQSIAMVVGRFYSIDVTVVSTSAVGVNLYVNNVLVGTVVGGTHRIKLLATTQNISVGINRPGYAVAATIDNISVRELPGNHAFQTTSTSRPVLKQDAGGQYYLKFDGVDDGMVTNSIDFTATDKMSVFAGVRKLSDAAAGIVAELSATLASNNGGFALQAPNSAVNTYRAESNGTTIASANALGFSAPITSVVTGTSDISGDAVAIRVNGSFSSSSTTDQGTGNYGNYPLYIGRRGGTMLPFNGHIYGLIVRGAATTDAKITQTEKWLAKKTGVTL
jgi:hypothetical protein